MTKLLQLAVAGLLLAGCRCSPLPEAEAKAVDAGVANLIDLRDEGFARLSDADRGVLLRYLCGSPRWSVVEERGARFAVRLEKAPKDEVLGEGQERREELIPGGYRGGSNGFYSDFESTTVVQRRVLLGLGKEHGFGNSRTPTRATAGQGLVSLKVYEPAHQQPGLESYLVVGGAAGWTLEIFEQSRVPARAFTEQALREVMEELEAALGEAEAILKNGYSAKLSADAPLRRGQPILRVDEGMQPGMYHVVGGADPGEPGRVFVRVVFEGPDPVQGPSKVPPELKAGEVLSEERVTRASTRWIGWGSDEGVLFPYQAGVTVYEGDWEHFYRARFELWFQPDSGAPKRKLVEATETISGWQR